MNSELVKKYRPQPMVDLPTRTWPGKTIIKPPIWCSVDLRDGNQALIHPMDHDKKMEMFNLLLAIGFKEIEVGFPAASKVEYDFIRTLIRDDFVPEDVIIQVLTQAKKTLIKETFAAVEGAREVIMHLYNSTSAMQRQTVFNMGRKEIVELAVVGARAVIDEADAYPATRFRYEYSPESFTGTELEFALEICEAVKEVWQPTPENKMIINLPATVEMTSPNVYADRIEWFCQNISNRDSVIISLHAHNDRGCAVAATELAMMAGGERVEGTLFGNGERTGNVDLVTLALNMFTQGVDPKLNFENMDNLVAVYERVCRMEVHQRQPYAGELVYTAFSGSHQDAINKGMTRHKKEKMDLWEVPYLPIDPADVGRTYEEVIRINSQSGKGGAAYIIEEFGFKMPKSMHPEFGAIIQKMTDESGTELQHREIFAAFSEEYLTSGTPYAIESFHVQKRHVAASRDDSFADVQAVLLVNGKIKKIAATGNGPLDAFCSALKTEITGDFLLKKYHEHALDSGSSSKAAAYILIEYPDGTSRWGVAVDTDIIIASVKAVLSSLNRANITVGSGKGTTTKREGV